MSGRNGPGAWFWVAALTLLWVVPASGETAHLELKRLEANTRFIAGSRGFLRRLGFVKIAGSEKEIPLPAGQ